MVSILSEKSIVRKAQGGLHYPAPFSIISPLCGVQGIMPFAGLFRQAQPLDSNQRVWRKSGFGAALPQKTVQWSVFRTPEVRRAAPSGVPFAS
jgi:hypothetical protein